LGWVGVEFALKAVGGAIAEGTEDLGNGEGEDELRELGLVLGEEVECEFLLGAHFCEAQLVALPINVAAALPLREVSRREGDSLPGKCIDDSGVKSAILDHPADGVAGIFGQAGDRAGSPMMLSGAAIVPGFEWLNFGRVRSAVGRRWWLGGGFMIFGCR
jgi:hypothetical protein